MPDGIDLKRIIDLDPETTVTDDDYTIVDSTNGGAKKFAIGQALGEIKDGLQDIEEEISHLDGLSEDVKQALLQIASKVAYIDEDGQDYYDALESALYPSVGLVSISAVYTQSGTVYDTDSLDSLKSDLVVTALYDDQTTETVTTYALSGTLTEGTSTITVSYGGKTTTFSVTVTAAPSYVTDGLFAQWDAIDNTGSAHDASATTWIDKINGYTWEAMKTDSTKTWAWDTDGLVFSPETTGSSGITQGKNTFKCTRPGTDLRTLEIVFSTDTADAQCLGEFTSNSSGISDANTQIIALASSDNTFITQGSQSSSFSVSSLSNIKSITATYNASKVPQKAYMNGSEVTTRGSSHSFKYHFYDNLILGAQNNSANLIYPFKGTIHAIRMYSKELTAEEIAYNYSLDVSRFGLGV